MEGRVGQIAEKLGRLLPEGAVRRLVGQALGGRSLALCMHRVLAERRASDWQPQLTIEPEKLDALIELLLASRTASAKPWLSVTFDDGYADAARYVESRAQRFPTVEWIFFVCPAKTEQAVGFRWDLGERKALANPESNPETTVLSTLDLPSENQRPELRETAQHPDYVLATLEACQTLACQSNVTLGNHTNTHHLQTYFTPEEVELEYQQSLADFQRLFGPQHHFAFPFGDYASRHVASLRKLDPHLVLWSTEPRPYAPEERVSGAVLPRYSVDGRDAHRAIALWIAARALISRVQAPRTLEWNDAVSHATPPA